MTATPKNKKVGSAKVKVGRSDSKKKAIEKPALKKKTAPKKNTAVKPKIKSEAVKHPGGRPPKFANVDDLEIQIEAFFKFCDDKIYPYTIHGLCVALDCTRDTLCEYEKKPEFSDTIKRAKEKIRWYVEKELFLGKNPTGMIFWLKNNAGWKDKQELEHSGAVDSSIKVEFIKP
jgi:hypothetical protein